MKKITILLLALVLLSAVLCCCDNTPKEREPEILPDAIKGKSFVFDRLEKGTGTEIFTLVFSDTGYKLYEGDGKGVISEGNAFAGEGKTLELAGKTPLEGKYTGGAFETPSVTLGLDGEESVFLPASENAEYVYISCLGVFEAEISGKRAFLILERWFEFYLYSEGELIRGTYEIYEDGSVVFSVIGEGKVSGKIQRAETDGTFDITASEFTLVIESEKINARNVAFSYARPDSTYDAYHAMGTYTLSLYGELFAIHGADGLLKAAGTLKKNGGIGTAEYFPRAVTGTAELGNGFDVNFTYTDDVYSFPEDTPLLPRSGNINETTGKGSYWLSGTPLEFVKNYERTESDNEYSVSGRAIDENGNPVSGAEIYSNGKKVGETESDGSFSIENLRGTHYIAVRKEGFEFDFNEVSEKRRKFDVVGRKGDIGGSKLPDDSDMLRQTMPSTGIAKPLVLLIDFPDYVRPRFVTAEGVRKAIFDIDNPDSLGAFYYRSSFGRLTIDGTVLDWYRASKKRASYSSDTELMAEAVNYYIRNEKLDLKDYDANGDGVLDSLYVLWAGNMNAGSDDMWSVAYRSSWYGSPAEWSVRVDGYIFVPGTTVWSSVPPLKCNVNSLTHETGHLLGLNDYYSYDTTDKRDYGAAYTGGALEGGMGGMDMMDANIADHNAFSKWLLGWIDPVVVEYEDIPKLSETVNRFSLRPISLNGDAIFVKLKPSETLFTELFVIEFVAPAGNAEELTRLKEPVVRILHVDASLAEPGLSGNRRSYGFRYDNSYTSTKFISVLEADGKDEVLNFVAKSGSDKISYSPDDYFRAGARITPVSYPNTSAYDEYGNATVYTGLTISVVSAGEKAEIALGYEEKTESLRISGISEKAAVVPYETGKLDKIPAGTKKIEFVFSEDISFVGGGKDKINVYSGNKAYAGFTATISGNKLVIGFDSPLAANRDYTIVIPQGTVTGKSGINNFNSIYGFVTATR